ncbi:MAG: FAD binding domain-containing protein [Ardenticatenaceae bacterium]
MSTNQANVIIMGGSLGGLTAGLFLRELGYRVTIYERSRILLAGRGAGIVLSPMAVRYFALHQPDTIDEMSLASPWVRYLGADGSIVAQQDEPYRFSSYNAIYRALLDAFGTDQYHLNAMVSGFEQDEQGVTVYLADGSMKRCDLLVCADGIRSTARGLLLGEVPLDYAGYIAWRGILSEEELSPDTFATMRDAITYHIMPQGHMLTYPIPVVDRSPDGAEPFVNWLWYRNIPPGAALDALMTDKNGKLQEVSLGPGMVRDENVSTLRQDATGTFPPLLTELILNSKQPFIQAVIDCEVPRMAFGRICILGDAAFAARPHTAAGTAKAAEDAWQLAQALNTTQGDILSALQQWQTKQLPLGRALVQRARQAGRQLQNGTWQIGHPLPFGLYQIGDTRMPDF